MYIDWLGAAVGVVDLDGRYGVGRESSRPPVVADLRFKNQRPAGAVDDRRRRTSPWRALLVGLTLAVERGDANPLTVPLGPTIAAGVAGVEPPCVVGRLAMQSARRQL